MYRFAMRLTSGMAVYIAVMALLTCLATPDAAAQRSKDTLRLPFKFPIDFVSYHYSGNVVETHFVTSGVFDTLVAFDETELAYKPLLAKAWRQVDPLTIEFDLQEDVTWHDGEKFDADDVVDSLNWLANPDNKIRNRGNWAWISRVEKTGPHQVRLIAKTTSPFALARLAAGTDIYPEHINAKLADRMQFGRQPVGTGMFKAVQVDTNKGIILEKNVDYKHATAAKPVGNIGRIHLLAIPDPGTQVAQLLADGVDMIRDPEIDQLEDLAKDPRFATHIDQRIAYIYLTFDSRGRAGQKALADVQVRKALMMSMDRALLTKVAVGDAPIPPVPALCWKPQQAGCDYSVALPNQDRAAAKKLLAEAGYPDGFDLTITCYTGTKYKRVAEVIAEDFRQVGVRTSIACVPAGTYLKMEREDKVQVVLAGFPAGSMPDVQGVLNLFAQPDRLDFHSDQELFALAREINSEMDPAKRTALGRKLFDIYTERAYGLPVAPSPAFFVHTKDIKITGGTMQTYGIHPGHINWVK